MLYELFRWTHILSYLIWLSALAGSLGYGFRIYQSGDKFTANTLIQSERLLAKWGTVFGATGIIISGWVLSTISQGPQWGWFDIQLYPWLALKQLLFVIILILIAIDLRRSTKLAQWMETDKKDENREAVKKWSAAYRISIAVYILVVISTLLGWYKPGLTTFG